MGGGSARVGQARRTGSFSDVDEGRHTLEVQAMPVAEAWSMEVPTCLLLDLLALGGSCGASILPTKAEYIYSTSKKAQAWLNLGATHTYTGDSKRHCI
jgi:hypothetical protein